MSVGDIADPSEAIAQLLREDMGADVEERVFRPELPQLDDPKMPTSALVVMPAGAGSMFGGSRMEVFDSMLDIICYGSTRLQADVIARKAQSILRLLAMRTIACPEVGGKVLVYWARIASGVNPRLEGPADWPFTEFTVQVMHSEFVL